MIRLDGEKGGGQILRTALSLSAVENKAFEIENIRGNRSEPGIKPQHLAGVKAVSELTGAKTDGAGESSRKLSFDPDNLEEKNIELDIGTAGAISLVFDTILPITTQFNSEIKLEVTGGTDVKWSPTLDYLKHVKLPLLRRFGFKGSIERKKTGYYPEGGGRAILRTEEFSLEPIKLERRGKLKGIEIFSKASESLKSGDVAERQAEHLESLLDEKVEVSKQISYTESDSKGSSLVLKAVYEESIAGFDALGERGKSSEEVADEVFEQFKVFESSEAAVDEHMADQLMVFVAIAGDNIAFDGLNNHLTTNNSVIESFGFDTDLGDRGFRCFGREK